NFAAFAFVQRLLLRIHTAESLGPGYFVGLVDLAGATEDSPASELAGFALDQLARFDVNALDRDVLRRLVLGPFTREKTVAWINEGRLKPQAPGLDFLKALAFHPDWVADPWIAALRRDGLPWQRALSFDEALSEKVLG